MAVGSSGACRAMYWHGRWCREKRSAISNQLSAEQCKGNDSAPVGATPCGCPPLQESAVMRCPNCGCENREGAKFCNECAAPLALRCPSCGTENRPGAKFCNECAASLTAPPSVPQTPDPGLRTS